MAARRRLALSIAVALVVLLPDPGAAYRRPGRISLLSLAHDGSQGTAFFGDSSRWPILTPDGRNAVFYSSADNLVPGDTNERRDVFLRDLGTGEIELLSRDARGIQGNHDSYAKGITPDGRFVTLESWALNWIPNDENGADVFVKDRQTGEIELISVSTSGEHANDYAFGGSISTDGRYVAFDSDATNLVTPDANGGQADVFVRDREAGTTTRVSISSTGLQADAFSSYGNITPDGRYVVFTSRATNLVIGDPNGTYDIFVHDRDTGTTTLASPAHDGAFGHSWSSGGQISADGRYVAFTAEASNLVPHDTNGSWDVFVHDREKGTTERVSVSSAGEQGEDFSSLTGFSPDGRFVMFQSDAGNLVPGDTSTCVDPLEQVVNCRDMFIHDRETGVTERLSVADDGTPGDAYSWEPGWVGPGGDLVAFMSEASNLVPGDTNGGSDVFLRERGPAVGAWDVSVSSTQDELRVTGSVGFAGATFVSATDAATDAGPQAALAGAELTGATVTYRREMEDLLFRVPLDQLPGERLHLLGNVSGLPVILYGFEFTVGTTRFEVRATPLANGQADPFGARFRLMRCEDACIEIARLSGGIGTTGEEVRFAVPLSGVGASEGMRLGELRAYSALADANGDPVSELDEVVATEAEVPSGSVFVGVAPAGTGHQEVEFDSQANLSEGAFAVGRAVGPPGGRVWVRACLGSVCSISSQPLP